MSIIYVLKQLLQQFFYQQIGSYALKVKIYNIFYMPRKQAQKNAPPVKKTGSNFQPKLTYEDRFQGVKITPRFAHYYESIKKQIDRLSKVLLRQAIIWNQGYPSELSIIRNYVQNYHEYYQYDQFDSQFNLLPSLDVNLYTVSNSELLYKCVNIFKGCLWQIRFGTKFASRVQDFKVDQIYFILCNVMLLAHGKFEGKSNNGQFGYIVPIDHRCIPHNRFFFIKIFRQKNILFNVGVQKVPICKGNTIKRYEFRNYIQFLDIVSDQIAENNKKLHEAVERYAKIINEDVAKRDHSDQLIIEYPKNHKTTEDMFQESENPYTGLKQVFERQILPNHSYFFRPLTFKPHYVSMKEVSTLIFNKQMKRWISSDELSKMERKALNDYQKKVNDEMIKRFLDFKSAKTLVELLSKIPNFKVNLTEQEKDVIGENGNVLVIGRSGTGKTTCAVLRLFAIEMLFKIRLSLYKKKFESSLKDTRCSADDIDQSMGLHCIFLTASPVLINQIERYYKKLTDNIKTELQKKKKKVQQENKEKELMMKKSNKIEEVQADTEKSQQLTQEKKDQEQQIIEVPDKLDNIKSKQDLEEEEEMNERLKGIEIKEEEGQQAGFEEDEDIDQTKQQFEEKLNKFKSLEDLEEQDYPGFFTVKSFIMMIDASLKRPFFIRKKTEATTTESQATWHNQKKGVMMIENYYRNQGQGEEDQEKLNEQIEEQINYSDEEELEHEYMRQLQLRENREKQKLTQKLNKTKKALSFEVDYNYFLSYFWPTVRHRHFSARNITPHLVWTEIYSTIKGGASSHLYPGLNLTEAAYIRQSTNVFLTKQEKLDIFETYCQYERWKIRSGGYDLMDAVNYILNYFRFRGFQGPDIHYIMIDQVQDLPHAIIYLLSRTVKYGVFYSGDTAQTIAKGIGFRFCDLKNLFDPKQFDSSLTLSRPVVKQLTINFRSHNNILQLANSIVSSIEILFPKTIDRLNKQISNITGPKPMILAEGDQELLFYVLCGDEFYKQNTEKEETAMKKPPLEFGCDQVIIVRDQQSKNRIPSMLQHALCLTIYEAKGLQFNDVILFNFFDESKCKDKWNLMKFLKVILREMKRQDYERSVTKHTGDQKKQKTMEQGQNDEQNLEVDAIVDQSENSDVVFIKKIVSDSKIYMKDINDYAELCSELKMLYTAITRPRKTLIMYDEDSGARKSIQKLWERLEVIELVSKDILNDGTKKAKQTEEIKIFKRVVNSTDSQQWKKQGLRMFSRGYFEQAMKCFDRSGEKDLYMKAEANMIADNASKKLIEIESQRSAIKNHMIQYQNMSESDLSKLKKKLKKQEADSYVRFARAGSIFEDLMMFKQSGQCYFSGKMFQKAYESFSKAFMNKQAAESLEMLNKYREAAELYEKDDNYLKVIECLDLLNEWQLILTKIQKYCYLMTEVQKQSLFKKYSSLALQELVYEIQFQNQPENQQKPENNRIEVIKEEEDSANEDDWDEDDDPELAAEKYMRKRSAILSQGDNSQSASRKQSGIQSDFNENQKIPRKDSIPDSDAPRKSSLIEQDKIIQESVYEHIEDATKKLEEPKEKQQNAEIKEQEQKSQNSSFADLNESEEKQSQPINANQSLQKLEQKQEEIVEKLEKEEKGGQSELVNLDNSSFVDIMSQESSFADLNSEQGDKINAKYPSQLQPDIESIKSLADPEDSWIRSALSQIRANTQTQYSMIDEDENYNPNVRIIKTKGNIFIQDQIMKKIVGIVSIVNSSVQEFFKQFKGYQSLITVSKDKTGEQIIDNRPEISEFEDVDPQFINIILDTLESFKLYKLCLFVCNRYHMPHKAGRYLVSMALKYSTNATVQNNLNPSLISPSLNRKSQLQKGILASIALHAIFENVSADFLKIKVLQDGEQESKNTLGSYFIEGLVLEGLYKKAVFMVNPEQSLKLLWNYSDIEIYQLLFKQKILKQQNSTTLSFLDHPPTTPLQENYTIAKLQAMLFDFNCITRTQFISQRFYREFNITDIKLKFDAKSVPNYLPYLSALFSEDHQQITACLKQNISQAYLLLKKGPNYKIFEIVSFLITVILKQNLQATIFALDHDEYLQVYRCISLLRKVIYSINVTPTSFIILQAIISAFSCKIIQPCKSMKFINDGFSLIKRTTVFCNYFVEEVKKNPNQCAYFFEQDYNLVLVSTQKLLKVLTRKFDIMFGRFLKNRSSFDFTYVRGVRGYMYENFMAEQAEELIKLTARQQEKAIDINRAKRKTTQHKKKVQKKTRPNFSYKNQGRPQLAILMDSQSDEDQQIEKHYTSYGNKYILPSLNPKLSYLHHTLFNLFNQKSINDKNIVPGSLLYCADLNDSYKEYIAHKGGYNLYDAIEFRKFRRLDLYAGNILSIINDLSFIQKPIFMGQILIHLLIQYKLLSQNKDKCRIQISRDFIRFLPKLKILQQSQQNINQFLDINAKSCIFQYSHDYGCEMTKQQIADLINQYLDIARFDGNYKNLSIQNLFIIFLMNMPYQAVVYETMRVTIGSIGFEWSNPVFEDIKHAKSLEQFLEIRSNIVNNANLLKKCVILHQIRAIDESNINKAIDDSEIDYEIKEKIMKGRKKAAQKIATWWKIVKRKEKPGDQTELIKENRLVRCTYNIKQLPSDDRLLLRTNKIRNTLVCFYLSHVITSSLDLHFILMTLNKIQDLRQKYLEAYSEVLVQYEEIDFEKEVSALEDTLEIWKKDSKWLKERNLDLKRKKVFEVKWMTKNNIHSKIIKKRAGLQKQKKLELKKKMIKGR